ncbi:efflux RND transporter periplasmic adaptor subunit [Paenalcaligenes suwonensis]|uniref:efflux RND transporter periplasmic adaptor subunit n=1 Tax=Paenalcaligenes suwonensis TaxID=1202713 RepID=UPI0014087C6C|nr:HlyD family efflux transporter periplasmic adaptor subunit [Paenalcaligenes suwonensis]NHC60073.1 HlyD family efflux transporter periplasmic adaptor subunit [Paenalcaligenes suwonensis]
MIVFTRTRCGVILTAASLLLAACSDNTSTSASTQAATGTQQESSRKIAVARGTVDVEGGLINLSSSTDGVVRALNVREGESVTKDQRLLTLSTATETAAVAVAESEWKLAQERRQASLAKLPELRRAASRLEQAARAGAVQTQLSDTAQQQLKDAEADARIAQAEVDVALQRLNQAKALLAQRSITAPEAGEIISIHAQPGAAISANTPAMLLLPARPLIVRAELNAAYVGNIAPGMQASITSDMDSDSDSNALPQARVIRVSPVYRQGRLQEEAQRGPVRVVECILEFEEPANVRVGQNVRVNFHE